MNNKLYIQKKVQYDSEEDIMRYIAEIFLDDPADEAIPYDCLEA